MKNLYFIPALLILLSGLVSAQDAAEEVVEVSTVEALLALVKEGKTQEQAANSQREQSFMANKNKQASILAAEKRELARQEKIADTLEAEYKKNEEILRVKEEADRKSTPSELQSHHDLVCRLLLEKKKKKKQPIKKYTKKKKKQHTNNTI